MKAVLVGSAGQDKVYYIIDSKPGEKDGAVEKPNGKIIKVDFMGFVSSCMGLKKIRTSRFHRLLWDTPKNPTRGSWYETFIIKTKPVNEKTLDGAVVSSSLGKTKTKLDRKNEAAVEFLKTKTAESSANIRCCGEMVQFDNPNYVFSTNLQRKQAWDAIVLMKSLEGIDND